MKKFSYKTTIDVYNKLGRKYLNDSLKVVPPERDLFTSLLPKGAHILDVGCGGGRDAKFFIKKGFKVTGIDMSSVLINIAKKEVPKANFKVKDILKLDFPVNSFDAIWGEAVILHLKRKDVSKAIKNLYKVLKPGGFLYLSVKKGKGEAYVKEKLSGGHERFYTYFTKKELVDLCKKQGLKVTHSKIWSDLYKRKGLVWVSVYGQK